MAKKFDPTPEQRDAIGHDYDKPAIVAAAAGSGKTTLLVERVVRLLSDVTLNISADQLAIMTFTKNATKSMREKLNRGLSEKLEALASSDDNADREIYDYLKKQIFLLRQAAISTIDAFCLRMIKENAEQFDLPLNFTIADGAKKAAMQSQAMKAALEDLYSGKFSDAERDALFFSFSFEDDSALENALLSVSEKLSCYPDPEKWKNDTLAAYKDMKSVEASFLELLDDFLDFNVKRASFSASEYSAKKIYEELVKEVANKRAKTKGKNDSLDKMENDVLPEIEKYIEFDKKRVGALVKDYEAYKGNKSAKLLAELIENLEANSENPPELFPRSGNNYANKKLFNKLCKLISTSVGKLLEFKPDAAAEQRELGFMQNALKTFFKLLDLYCEYYAYEKRAAGCIDFSDGERELYNKLSENNGSNDFRRQLSQRFKCVIVDEFQDCNNIQAKIFELLGEGRLFYVGDVKQSIYAFRGADPYIMAEICDNAYTEDREYNSDESGDIKFKKLLLNTNFRSRRAVVDTVNAAFTGLMTPTFGGVDYAKDNQLHEGAKYPPINDELYDTEIAFVHSASRDDENDEDNEKSMALAKYVAKRIRKLVDDESFLVCDGVDENENFITRRARYSDFIVLLRAKTNINNYRKALKELNIPSTSKSGSGFFEADEIKLVWNYLKIIDNPLLDESFLKVLMSPIYRFSAEEAAQIKMGILGLEEADGKKRRDIAESYRRRSFFSSVNACLSQKAMLNKKEIDVKRSVSPKLAKFADDFKAFRYHMTSSSLTELVRKIYEDTELISIVAAFEDSPQRVGNIRQLQRMAAGFESRGGGGLGDFLRFLERAAENASRGVEEAAQPEGGMNAVRIMTFHASKGLEAPVCIISELQKKMSDDDYTGNLIVNYEHYMAMTHTDFKRRKKTKMLAYQALSKFVRNRELGSELRLLYVAMTRAQEKLIMVSTIGSDDYKDLNKLVHDKSPLAAPELHDAIYEGGTPFKCVFYSLMQHAPAIGKDMKEFSLNNIACRVSAVETNEKRGNSESVDMASDEDEIPAEEKIEKAIAEKEIPAEIPEEKIAALIERMNAKYAHPEDTVQQAKYSTTELAHKKDAKPIELTKPAFARGGRVSGVEKGNAYHHCMEHFPLDLVNVGMNHETLLKAVKKALEEMEKSRKVSAEDVKIVEAERIAAFFESDLGKRMLKAYAGDKDNVKREQAFYAEVNGDEVRLDYKGRISIQGRTDMYFIEDGKIVVVDYKSDTIENLKKEQESYKFQVEIYTKVLGRYTGMEVKDMYLYAFTANSEYKVGS